MHRRTAACRLALSAAAVLLVAGCGGGSDDAAPSAGASASDSPTASAGAASPSASKPEPTAIPFDKKVLTTKRPTSLTQAVKVVNGSAPGTVVAVRPLGVKRATAAQLAGLPPGQRRRTTGKDPYLLTYSVTYVNGKVQGLAPSVTLGLLGRDDNPMTSLISSSSDVTPGCGSGVVAGEPFGAGSSITTRQVEVSGSGSPPGAVQYVDYENTDVHPVWPVR